MISENNDFMCSCQNSNNFRSFKARKTIRISFKYLIVIYFLGHLISQKWNGHIMQDLKFVMLTGTRKNCQNTYLY